MKYANTDEEDMTITIAEIQKHWVVTEPEVNNSSSKKNRGPRKITQFLRKFKINF